MRRFTIYLLVAVLGFSAGLLAHALWPVPVPSPEINRPLAVSLCELNRNPELYDGEVVQVKAVLYGGPVGPFIVDEACGAPNDHLSKMIGVYVDANRVFPVRPEWASNTLYCGNDTYAAMVYGGSAEVIITGTFEAGYLGPDVAPEDRQSQIIPRSILQLSLRSKRR